MFVIGIDPHKGSHTAAVLDDTEELVGSATNKKLVPLGLRWPVERTNSWLSNFGQLRRNTDRRVTHRLAQLTVAIVLLLTAKLIDWRDRWTP